MIEMKSFDELASITNNKTTNKERLKEKLECVPYVWLFIVSERIDKYIKDHLTDEYGLVNQDALDEEIYPFYVKINNTDHTHVNTDNESIKPFYSKTVGTKRQIKEFEFKDDKVGIYSLRVLRLAYFTKSCTLRLKNRLQNDLCPSKTNAALMKVKETNQYTSLSDEELIIVKNMYVDSIFRLDWASPDAAPEWYYPYPETRQELAKAIEVALRIVQSKKVNVTKAAVINKSVKIKDIYKNKI